MKHVIVDRHERRIHLRNILHNAGIMPREHYRQIRRISINGKSITDMEHYHVVDPARPNISIGLYGITHLVKLIPSPS